MYRDSIGRSDEGRGKFDIDMRVWILGVKNTIQMFIDCRFEQI